MSVYIYGLATLYYANMMKEWKEMCDDLDAGMVTEGTDTVTHLHGVL